MVGRKDCGGLERGWGVFFLREIMGWETGAGVFLRLAGGGNDSVASMERPRVGIVL